MLTRRQAGLSIIELMIGIAIVTILLATGMQSYSSWVQNQRVRVAAEAILNGIQLARVEAVRRNLPVQFKLTGSRAGWQVQTVIPGSVTQERVQSRSAAEDSADVSVSGVSPLGATSIMFNGFGRVMAVNLLDLSAPITEINVLNATSQGLLRIVVSSAGNVRMCDPHAPTGDPKAC